MRSSSDDEAVSEEVQRILDSAGITDERVRRGIVREARRNVREKARASVERQIVREALGSGWRPPSPAERAGAPLPLPMGETGERRFLSWATRGGSFSVRDVYRAWPCTWATPADVEIWLDRYVSRRLLRKLPAPPRKAGRPPSPRYVATDPIRPPKQSTEPDSNGS